MMSEKLRTAYIGTGVVGRRALQIDLSNPEVNDDISVVKGGYNGDTRSLPLIKDLKDIRERNPSRDIALYITDTVFDNQQKKFVLLTEEKLLEKIEENKAILQSHDLQLRGIFTHNPSGREMLASRAGIRLFNPANHDILNDFTDKYVTAENFAFLNKHRRQGTPITVQGGTKPVSLIPTYLVFGTHTEYLAYPKLSDATVMSCNTHALTYAATIAVRHQQAKSIDALLLRRFADEEDADKKYKAEDTKLEPNSHHAEDIKRAAIWLRGTPLTTNAAKLPHRYCHFAELSINYERPLSQAEFEHIIELYKNTSVTAYSNTPLFPKNYAPVIERHEKLGQAAHHLKSLMLDIEFPDGDAIITSLYAEPEGSMRLYIQIATQQRSITVPTTVTQNHINRHHHKTQEELSPIEAFRYVMGNHSYAGRRIGNIKYDVERALRHL